MQSPSQPTLRANSDPAIHDASEPTLETGHVLFMDIVGYSKLRMNEQAAMQTELSRIVSETPDVQKARKDSKLIVRPMGDGMALIFLRDMVAPVRCALQIHDSLVQNYQRIRKATGVSGVKIRMGIHSGPILMVEDLNAQSDVAGDGIIIAQRVMDCGDAGHILVSENVARDLMKLNPWQNYLSDLGICRVKHGVPVHLFNLYGRLAGDYRGSSSIPSKVAASQDHETRFVEGTLLERQPGLRTVLRAAPLLAVLLLFGGAWKFYPPFPTLVQAKMAQWKTKPAGPPGKTAKNKPATASANNKKHKSSGGGETARPVASYQSAAAQSTVPDLTGRTYEDAKATAEAEGLHVAKSNKSGYNTQWGEGIVYAQSSPAGASLPSGRTIHVRVSKGDPPDGASAPEPSEPMSDDE